MVLSTAVSQVSKQTRGGLSEEGLRRLGFREHPFRLSADPRFLYLSVQHNAALQRLSDVVNWREGLAVVEGPIGVGKTTVARRLYELYAIEPGFQTVYIHTANYATRADALRDIARAYSLPRRRAYLDQLRGFEQLLVDSRAKGTNAVVIIDDAQQMKPEALSALQDLFNFDLSVKLVQCILFGQPEIHGVFFENKPVLDRVASWQKLSPLLLDDTLAMLQFRCQVAGRQAPLLTDTAFLKLFEFTKGVPRPIMILCSEILLLLARQGRSTAEEEDVEQAIASYLERSEKV